MAALGDALAERYSLVREYALNFDFVDGVTPLSNWKVPAVRSRAAAFNERQSRRQL
jgi:hypothetical protein